MLILFQGKPMEPTASANASRNWAASRCLTGAQSKTKLAPWRPNSSRLERARRASRSNIRGPRSRSYRGTWTGRRRSWAKQHRRLPGWRRRRARPCR
eukprot:813179-Pyramimonas_sp.AAC.1